MTTGVSALASSDAPAGIDFEKRTRKSEKLKYVWLSGVRTRKTEEQEASALLYRTRIIARRFSCATRYAGVALCTRRPVLGRLAESLIHFSDC